MGISPSFPARRPRILDGSLMEGSPKPNQADAVSVAGSTFTPGPWVEEMAIFFR